VCGISAIDPESLRLARSSVVLYGMKADVDGNVTVWYRHRYVYRYVQTGIRTVLYVSMSLCTVPPLALLNYLYDPIVWLGQTVAVAVIIDD